MWGVSIWLSTVRRVVPHRRVGQLSCGRRGHGGALASATLAGILLTGILVARILVTGILVFREVAAPWVCT
jgi:hypothetical protein